MRLERTRYVSRLGGITLYKTAESHRGFMFNRYPGMVIGIAVGLGRQCLSYVSPVTLVHDERKRKRWLSGHVVVTDPAEQPEK